MTPITGTVNRLRLAATFALFVSAGCSGKEDLPFTGGGSYSNPSSSGDDTSTDDTGDADDTGDTSDSGEPTDDTGEWEMDQLDGVGDIVEFNDIDASTDVDLSDEDEESNKDQEFYLILYNTAEDGMGYSLEYRELEEEEEEEEEEQARIAPSQSHPPDEPEARQRLQDAIDAGELGPARRAGPVPPPWDDEDIGVQSASYRVRTDLNDETAYADVQATLVTYGENVAFWLDDDVAMDWDTDCDGSVDQEDERGAYGFDNCDLVTLTEIADSNIVYNIREYYGTESDLDGNERVNFVITPWVNRLSLTSTDEDDFEVLVEAYSDALVDLNERDEDLNPLSDEQEVIYLFAPDPNGFANPYATRTVDDLAGIGLLHSLARHYYELVSYNQRVLEKETDAEEPWLVDVLGTVAADLIGFGAAIYGDAWDYMDAPHLFPLVYTDDEGILIRENRGAQWLFGRWLVDVYGTDVVRDLTQTEDSGTTNVRAVTATEFEHVVARWQVALLTTRETDENGDDLVDLADYPPYENSTQGDATYFYGAENYQMGVDIDGVNKYLEGGATESPSEVTDLRVRLGHTDHYTLVPGVDLYGYVEGGYAAQVVRLVGAPYDTTVASIRSEAAGLGGVVIRWNDPETLDYAVEDVFSATDPTNVAFPEFPSTEEPQYGVGEISEAGTTTLLDEDGDETVKYVYDTDRWLLDLTSRDADYDVELAIWLDRRYSDDVGGMSLTDPWLAVVEAEYVPAPTVDDIQRGECDAEVDTGETIVDFAFPVSVLEYLYYQEFLAASPVPDDGLTTGEDGGFDACGEGIEEGDTGDTGDTGEAEDTGSDSSYVGTYTGAFEMVVTTTGAYVVSDTCEGTMTLEVDEDDDPQAEGEFECSWTGSTIIGASSGDIEDYYTEISDGTIAGEDMTATVEFWGLTDTMEGTFVSEDEFQGFFVFSGTVEGYDMEFSATFDLLLDEDEDEDEDDEEEEVERTCANDWDMDGVLDEDEPQPDTLMEQVHVMQCTAAGGDGSEVDWVEGSRVDTDSTDEDDDYSFDHKRNLAGRSGVSGEEAYLEVTLPGGAEYLLIVGAGSYAGPYELTIQEL